MAVITLDRDALDQARAIVDRERPTPQQETLFQWTARLILATIVLVAVWVVDGDHLFPSTGLPVRRRADVHDRNRALCLQCGLRLAAVAIILDREKAWLALAAYEANVEGVGLVGVPGVHPPVCWVPATAPWCLRTRQGNGARQPVEFLVALSVVSFGVGCLLLLPMDVVRRRVNAMRALRGALDSTRPADAGKVEVPAREYDRITDIEFRHTVIDSLPEPGECRIPTPESAVRLRPAFQEAVANLPEAESDLVYDLIGDLDGRAELANAARRR